MQRTSITLITLNSSKSEGFFIPYCHQHKEKETTIKNNERTGFRETVPTDNHRTAISPSHKTALTLDIATPFLSNPIKTTTIPKNK